MLFKTKKICNCHYVRKHLNLFKAKFKSSKRVFFIKLIEMVSFKLISNKENTQTQQKYHFLRLQNNRTTNSNTTKKINPPPSDASRERYWLTLKPHRTNKKAHGKIKLYLYFWSREVMWVRWAEIGENQSEIEMVAFARILGDMVA